MRAWMIALAACALAGLSGCGYSSLQRQDENVRGRWAEVVNQYQGRSDLVPNLVRTVQAFSTPEQQVLIGVRQAQARADSVPATPEMLNDPAAFAKYQEAQGQLSQSVKSLIAAVEAYPQLKSDANFRDLQARLDSTEKRITAARDHYIDAVRDYNTTVRSFPTSLTARLFDFQAKPNLAVAADSARATPPGAASRSQ